jgi:VWFA-related protein
VRDEGKPQPITNLASDLDTPLTVALLLDVSGSVAAILPVEKAAAGSFFHDVLRPGDQAMLVGFAELVAVWQDLTAPGPHLDDTLERAGSFQLAPEHAVHRGAGTLLYDAVSLVARQKLRDVTGRKIIVLITDGLDVGSEVKPQEAVRAAQEADAIVYAIHYTDDHVVNASGMRALEKLAEPTGGRVFHVDHKTTLNTVFTAIQEEMRNQYSLGFRRPEGAPDGAYRRIEVNVSKPGVKVQARQGYYTTVR